MSIFRLGPFYKYNFPLNLTNIETNLDDIFVQQQDPFEWDYYLKRFKLQGRFSDDLKNSLKSTTNESNVSKTAPTPQNLKEIFMLDKKNYLIKICFQ